MPQPERFGRLLLLEQFDLGSLGLDFRALELLPGKPASWVNLLKLSENLTRDEATLKRLITEAKASVQLGSPNILKLLRISKVQETYGISYPWQEGKSLKAIFRKSRREGFPLAADHALLIGCKVARALELAHSRKFEGVRYFHGSLFPSSIFVTYEGEVRVRGFGLWGALRDRSRSTSRWGAEESLYLAPEQFDRFVADHRSDLFTVGTILFEMLTGHPYFEMERSVDFPGRILSAKLAQSPGGERSLAPELVGLLQQLLAPAPDERLSETAEVRQRMEKLLFTGEFQPTTFNLAFFMHSLFRAEIDQEARTRQEEQENEPEYRALVGDSPPASTPRSEEPAGETRETPSLPALRTPSRAELPGGESAVAVVPPAAPPARASGASGALRAEAGGELFAPAAERPTSRILLLAAAASLFAALGWLGYRYVRPEGIRGLGAALLPSPPAVQPLPPERQPAGQNVTAAALDYDAELARLREEMEKAKEAELAQERERLRQEVQKELEGRTDSLLAAELKRREKELEERYRRQQDEERKRIEQELAARYEQEQETLRRQAAAEKERQQAANPTPVADSRPADLTPPPADGSRPAAPPEPAAPSPLPVTMGELVDADDPELVPPRPRRRVMPEYPPLAARQRLDAEVVVSALVSHTGDVQEVRLLQSRRGNLGFDEAAIRAVQQYKFEPATKRGVRVRVWFNVIVRFTP
jgi:TonB family protein